jgi:DNA-binding response OmpR family regulator
MKKILVVDDEKPVRDVLTIALREEGYSPLEASDGEEGIQLCKANLPDVVITDVMMPGIDGIEVTKQIKSLSAKIDVVIMSGFGTEELVINALRAGASNYLKKPIVFDELFSILDDIIFRRENRKRFEIAKDVVSREHKEIVMGNNLADVWGAVNQVLFNVRSAAESSSIEGLNIGLYELIVNAIEHGNLGISFEEKSEALQDNTYRALLEQRMEDADDLQKKVTIRSEYNRSELTVEITDQGKGFDLSSLPDMKGPEAIMSDHGRGILLASLFYDEVTYKDPGNCVTLVKRFNRSNEGNHRR